MSESDRRSSTHHGDAPLSAARAPDARAMDVGATEADEELIARTVTINRPLNEVRDFLGQDSNLLRISTDEDEEPLWDALTIEADGQRRLVSMRGPDQGNPDAHGYVTLRSAPADRGTEVTIAMATEARGFIERAVDRLTGSDPRLRSRRALRRLKQLLETGEIATSAPGRAAPRA